MSVFPSAGGADEPDAEEDEEHGEELHKGKRFLRGGDGEEGGGDWLEVVVHRNGRRLEIFLAEGDEEIADEGREYDDEREREPYGRRDDGPLRAEHLLCGEREQHQGAEEVFPFHQGDRRIFPDDVLKENEIDSVRNLGEQAAGSAGEGAAGGNGTAVERDEQRAGQAEQDAADFAGIDLFVEVQGGHEYRPNRQGRHADGGLRRGRQRNALHVEQLNQHRGEERRKEQLPIVLFLDLF